MVATVDIILQLNLMWKTCIRCNLLHLQICSIWWWKLYLLFIY